MFHTRNITTHPDKLVFRLLLGTIVLLSSACAPQKNQKAVAKIEGETLTLSALTSEAEATNSSMTSKSIEIFLKEVALRKAKAHLATDTLLPQDIALQARLESLLASAWDEHYKKQFLADTAQVSEKEIAAFYQQHIREYTTPSRMLVAMIKIEAPQETNLRQQAKTLADSLYRKLAPLNGKSLEDAFNQATLQHSIHQASRYKGGKIGYFTEGASVKRFPSSLINALFELPSDTFITEVIEDSNAFYIGRRIHQEPQRVETLQAVNSQIRYKLKKEKEQQAWNHYHEELIDNHIVFFRENLPQFEQMEQLEQLERPQTEKNKEYSPPLGPTN